jgi:hypothetical protein
MVYLNHRLKAGGANLGIKASQEKVKGGIWYTKPIDDEGIANSN